MANGTTEPTKKPDVLTAYLEENPSVKELLAQYEQTKEVLHQAQEAGTPSGLLYPFYGYSSNA